MPKRWVGAWVPAGVAFSKEGLGDATVTSFTSFARLDALKLGRLDGFRPLSALGSGEWFEPSRPVYCARNAVGIRCIKP